MVTNGWSSPTYVLLLPVPARLRVPGARPRRPAAHTGSRRASRPAALEPGAAAPPPRLRPAARRPGSPDLGRTLPRFSPPGGVARPSRPAGVPARRGAPRRWRRRARLRSSSCRSGATSRRRRATGASRTEQFANFYDFANIFGLFLFIAVPFLFALWRRELLRADQPRGLGLSRALAMWVVGLVVAACCALSLAGRAARSCRPARRCRASLRLGLAVLSLLASERRAASAADMTRRIVAVMFAFAFAITAGTDIVYVWDRMNTLFKFYLETVVPVRRRLRRGGVPPLARPDPVAACCAAPGRRASRCCSPWRCSPTATASTRW